MYETTVLIPTYNCGPYIKQAIESVLKQKYTNYELLIIDDGSTDNTEETVNEFTDPRIRYCKQEKNFGIVNALNLGLSMAKGEFIARMDADDIMTGERLADQISFLKQRPDYAMVGSWYQVISEKGNLLRTIQVESESEKIRLGLLFRNQFAHPTVTIRTKIAKKLCYDQDFLYTEDYDLWCRVSAIANVSNLSKINLSYRWYANNSCNRKQKELKQNVIRLLSRELDRYGIAHSVEELILHSAVCFGYGKVYFNTETKISALKKWVGKIFRSSLINERFKPETIAVVKSKILKDFII